MRKLLIAGLLLIAGCTFPPSYQGTVKVKKVNGLTKQVEVTMMGSTLVISDNHHIEALIKSLETLVSDLKNASDQMEIVEPKLSGGTK